LRQEVLRLVGAEGRTVIGFQDQRRAVLREQRAQRVDGVVGVGVFDGKPEELLTACQIAHGQEMRMAAVDGRGGLAVVHGPDDAGRLPAQDARSVVVAALPDTAVAAQEILKFGARHEREALAERGQSGSRAEFVEYGQDGASLVARRTDRGPAQRDATKSAIGHLAEVGAPGTQRARREAEQIADLEEASAVLVEIVGEPGDVAAQGFFAAAFGKLRSGAAATLLGRFDAGLAEFQQTSYMLFFLPRVDGVVPFGRCGVFFYG